MNTGIHDATNFAWKLAGVLRGWYSEDILDTYDTERRSSAEHLIQLDRDIAALISGRIPAHFNAPPDADPNDYLEKVFSTNASFTVGLGICYAPNLLNIADASDLPPATAVHVGHRAPDVPLYRPGAGYPRRLLELISYNGQFWILVFAGSLEKTADAMHLNHICSAKYSSLHGYITSSSPFIRQFGRVVDFLTILLGKCAPETSQTIGAHPLGRTVYDQSGDAYASYGVDAQQGGLVVLRPDGIVGFMARLDGGEDLNRYFGGFARPCETSHEQREVRMTAIGEIALEDQTEFVRSGVSMSK